MLVQFAPQKYPLTLIKLEQLAVSLNTKHNDLQKPFQIKSQIQQYYYQYRENEKIYISVKVEAQTLKMYGYRLQLRPLKKLSAYPYAESVVNVYVMVNAQ